MSGELERVLRADLALAEVDEALLRAARELHRQGFTPENLRPAQMAAVGETIRGASSQSAAAAAVAQWMARQLEKLRAKAERSGRKSSWWREPEGEAIEGRAGSLGEELVRWLAEERYLADVGGEGVPPALDRLAAQKRFWDGFHGLYRYREALGEPMPLGILDLKKEGGEELV